jgi:hypothetical protein
MLSLFLLAFSTLATAYLLPSAAPATKAQWSLDDTCTFTLLHRQHSSINYSQLNKIIDHANNITVDVASQRPAAAFNSYTRLDRHHAFAVTGLLDDERLTIKSSGDDILSFEVGEVRWSTEESKDGGRCNAGEWMGSGRNRVSSMSFDWGRLDVLIRGRNEAWNACFLAQRRLLRAKRMGLHDLGRKGR